AGPPPRPAKRGGGPHTRPDLFGIRGAGAGSHGSGGDAGGGGGRRANPLRTRRARGSGSGRRCRPVYGAAPRHPAAKSHQSTGPLTSGRESPVGRAERQHAAPPGGDPTALSRTASGCPGFSGGVCGGIARRGCHSRDGGPGGVPCGDAGDDAISGAVGGDGVGGRPAARSDRKSTRLNSSHVKISYAVFCLKKKNNIQ